MQISRINTNLYTYKNCKNLVFSGKSGFSGDELILTKHKPNHVKNANKTLLLWGLHHNPVKQSEYYKRHGVISKNIKLADGFLDCGKSGTIYTDGSAKSKREIVVVDRRNDSVLTYLIKHVKDATKDMDEKQKANYLFSYLSSYIKDRGLGTDRSHSDEYTNKKVRVGDCFINSNAEGRHDSIVYKVLADEIGVKADLIKGTLLGRKHAWNIVYLPDSKPKIVDISNGFTDDPKLSHVYKRAK